MNAKIREILLAEAFWRIAEKEDVRHAIGAGAEIYCPDTFAHTTLHIAIVSKGRRGAIEELLKEEEERASKIDSVRKRFIDIPDQQKRTALHLAVLNNREPEILRLLLEHKADVNVQEEFEKTPLHLAAQLAIGPAVVELLLDTNGICGSTRDWVKKTALDYALTNRHLQGNAGLLKRLEVAAR